MRARWSFTLLLLACTGLSGCVEDEAIAPVGPRTGEDEPLVSTDDGDKPVSRLDANDTIAAPVWRVGDWFGHHVYLRGGAADGRHYNTVVIAGDEAGWSLAPDDAAAAKEEAAWDLPVAGHVGRDLEMTAFGATWDLFRFPLGDGARWRAPLQVRDFEYYEMLTFDVTFVATFDAAIPVNGVTHPGFRVQATLDNGTAVVDASYIPAIGWYGHITILDPRSGDPSDFFLHTTSMGHGTGWDGPYFIANGGPVVDHFSGFVVFAPTEVLPQAPARFEVPDEETLYGIVFAFGWGGVATTLLVDPHGNVRETTALGPRGGLMGEANRWFVDEPAMPGTWSLATAGAGPLWVAGAELFAFTVHEARL